MKQYEISNLYVIKIGEFIFFCEKHLENTYKDIFTDEIFNKETINFVRPMEDLYELEVMKKMLAGEKMILTKRELLIKFAKVNSFYFERIASHNRVYDLLKEKEEYLKVFKEFSEKYPEKAKEIAKKTLKYKGD